MGEILLKQALGLAVLLVFGGLMAGVAAVLPRLVDRWEASPEPRGWGVAEETPSAGLPQPAAPPPSPSQEMAPTATAVLSPVTEEPLLAAAIAVALTLYHQEAETASVVTSSHAPGTSPWAWSGRWQTMQARVKAQKR